MALNYANSIPPYIIKNRVLMKTRETLARERSRKKKNDRQKIGNRSTWMFVYTHPGSAARGISGAPSVLIALSAREKKEKKPSGIQRPTLGRITEKTSSSARISRRIFIARASLRATKFRRVRPFAAARADLSVYIICPLLVGRRAVKRLIWR